MSVAGGDVDERRLASSAGWEPSATRGERILTAKRSLSVLDVDDGVSMADPEDC
jgi:hypothetical protein